MKLWVDDIRNPPDNNWHIARDCGSAIRALERFYEDITDINLDHDISHQIVMGQVHRPYACVETFQAVARYIALLKKYQDGRTDEHRIWEPKVRIHTSNFNGAHDMKAILEEVGIVPDLVIAPGANRLEMEV